MPNTGKRNPDPPPAVLRDLLSYDPETGVMIWKAKSKFSNVVVGSRAGSLTNEGYRRIKFMGREYRCSNLAWWLAHGFWPDVFQDLDHRNNDRADDRIDNLRLASSQQNKFNRLAGSSFRAAPKSSRFKGVCWAKDTQRWQASITLAGRLKYLGQFPSEEEAASAYDAVAAQHHGEFARLNGVAA